MFISSYTYDRIFFEYYIQNIHITYSIKKLWRKKKWNKFVFDKSEQYATTAIHVFVIVIRWLFFSFRLLLFSFNSVLFYGAFSGLSRYFVWFVTRHSNIKYNMWMWILDENSKPYAHYIQMEWRGKKWNERVVNQIHIWIREICNIINYRQWYILKYWALTFWFFVLLTKLLYLKSAFDSRKLRREKQNKETESIFSSKIVLN